MTTELAPPAHYYTIHTRLRRTRGRAAEQPCASCGGQAADWAYDKTDPAPLHAVQYDGRKVIYSADLESYAPLCKPCHVALDSPRPTECPQGHAYTTENTHTRPNGWRYCRACAVERTRRWRAANPDWRTRGTHR